VIAILCCAGLVSADLEGQHPASLQLRPAVCAASIGSKIFGRALLEQIETVEADNTRRLPT
jgi:hypothetical protein